MKEIPLMARDGSIRAFAQVDDEDFERLSQWVWRLSSAGYAVRGVKVEGKYKTVLMHREVLNCIGGVYFDIDHIDNNPLNNTKTNLRPATRSQNMANTNPTQRGGTSVYKGVYFNKYAGRWHAKIGAYGKCYYIGLFDTEEEAAIAYNKKALELFGEFAKLNEIA